MTWVIGINTWKQVEHFNCNQRGGRLFRSNEFPDQWKWRGNIVLAGSLDEAKEKLAQQYRPDCDYWERIGIGNFMWVDYAFHADTESEGYDLLLERFGKRETA